MLTKNIYANSMKSFIMYNKAVSLKDELKKEFKL